MRFLPKGKQAMLFSLVLLAGCPPAGQGAANPVRQGMVHDCPRMSYTPIGAVAPATPMFCMRMAHAPTTFVSGANSWVDNFDHGASMAALDGGYRTFERIDEVERSATFRHNDHWMVDVQPDSDGSTLGGSFLRPDRSFRFVKGKLVVEMTVAAGIREYDTDDVAWPEIAVSTADHPSTARNPTGEVPDEGYGIGHFPDATTVGIRLHASRVSIMGLWRPDLTRTWELSFFQDNDGQFSARGGYPEFAPSAWRTCRGTDPDTNCRDTFRWELTASSITLYVNGELYMRHTGARILPAALIDDDVYVYAISWINEPDKVVRFHWDRIAVNP